MEIEAQTLENTRNIGALTTTVTELATIVKFTEERHKEDRDNSKEIVNNLKALNDKIGAMALVQKEMSDLTGEVGKLRHDLRNVENALNGVTLLHEKLSDAKTTIGQHEARLDELIKWKDKHDGAAGALKGVAMALWAVFGSGILAVGGFILYLFFKSPGGGGMIGGE